MLKREKMKTGNLGVRRIPWGKWGISLVLALVFLIAGFVLGRAVGADPLAVPGSEKDPLVTASWVEAKLDAFARALKEEQTERQKLEDRMRQLEGDGVERPVPGTPIPSIKPPAFEIVVVPSGRKLLTGASTEIILRSGSGKAVEGPGGGLSNLTKGVELLSGDRIERDHLLLSPRGDGRGVIVEKDAIFMVRGEYRIE